MSEIQAKKFDDRLIKANRGRKKIVDPYKPYGWLLEKELSSSGRIEDVAIIFLTNRECPFSCLMCDLWKNTTDESVPPGAIPAQIEFALGELPQARHLKLYNSGSFFDTRAIPPGDYRRIADIISGFETAIVESHPKLIGEKCLEFKKMLKPDLQVAIGLEVSEPVMLANLNKQMTPGDFRKSVSFLKRNEISSRAFILLRPPFLSEEEGVSAAEQSIEYAFSSGAECCIIIPVRAGNGTMEILQEKGVFTPPAIESLERVIEYGINLRAGRVFADLWDLELFSRCSNCFSQRFDSLRFMNLNQIVPDQVECNCQKSA